MHVQKTAWGNAKKCAYEGYTYMSRFEASYAKELDLRLSAKEIAGWRKQVKLELRVNGYLVCNYYVDFAVDHLDGTVEYVETKGYATDVWRLKWKLTEAIYGDLPGVRLTLVKQGRPVRFRGTGRGK